MIKIEYPKGDELEKFKLDYLKTIFPDYSFSTIEEFNKLNEVEHKTLKELLSKYNIEEQLEYGTILTSELPPIVEYCKIFKKVWEGKNDDYKKNVIDEFKNIFNYMEDKRPQSKKRGKIADFFIKHKLDLKISTCFYCNMTYVNAFSYTESSKEKGKQQFDLDHMLPESKYPIVALSLFNFVPSCQFCNSRMKSSKEYDCSLDDYIKLSPTSTEYAFDENVRFKILPISSSERGKRTEQLLNKNNQLINVVTQNQAELYDIEIACQKGGEIYEKEIELFKLKERYNFHKIEAMRLKELQAKYPRSKIIQMAELLKKPPEQVFEDIFCNSFFEENNRAFSKLHKDIMKIYNDYFN